MYKKQWHMLKPLAMTLSYKKTHIHIAIFRETKKSTKILKRRHDLRDFRYRYAFLQKIKNVLTYYEQIFDFLKKSVPITEIPEIRFPFQDFY
jgi:hypothetical protein